MSTIGKQTLDSSDLKQRMATVYSKLKLFESSFFNSLKSEDFVDVLVEGEYKVAKILSKTENSILVNFDGYSNESNTVV